MANISEISIRRPVLSTVMMLVVILFGVIGYTFLGVREYPSVDQPIITVTASYPGANAEVIMNQITEPLEQNINGIPGIRSLSSTSSQGQSRITVEFELSVDMETAANDVRDKVSRAQRNLPRDCDPPTISKADADATPIMQIAVRSANRSLMELSEIAELTVKERLQTIPDVSSVDIWGEKRYSMRLWLDPVKMAGYGVTPLDVRNAVDRENVELPSGSIEGDTKDLSIRTMGLMTTAQEFNDLIIKEENGNIVRFSDIGYAEVSPQDLKSILRKNGEPMVIDVIVPQPGANHIEIAEEAYRRLEEIQKDLPDDVTVEIMYDNTRFIRASINEVKDTLYEALILVILIIFLFLRDWRVTLIPCVVIPISLIGSFFVMYVAGFSVNVLTMLAVVLAVGPGGGRCDRDDGKHLRKDRTRDGSAHGRDRRFEGDFLCGDLDHHYADLGLFAHRLHGGYDRAFVQGIQHRDRRCGGYFGLRRPDLYSDAGYQTAEKTGEKELVLPQDRAFLPRDEQASTPDGWMPSCTEGCGRCPSWVSCWY